jgi:hypothetical protein
MADPDPIIERLEDQISWYDRKSASCQTAYRRIKTVEIVAAAVIPLMGAIKWVEIVWVTGGLGVLITVLEGLLHLNRYQQNWLTYRSTCESLKHEKYVYIAGAAPYAGVANPRALLAERVEGLVGQEHAKWTATQQSVGEQKPPEAAKPE